MKARLLAFSMCAILAVAQPLKFEVASVKNANPASNAGVAGGCHGIDSKYSPKEAATAPPLGRCVITDGRLGHMINIAWGLRSMLAIKGGPDWVLGGFDRFSLEAKAEDPAKATEAQLSEMLQNLLVERFKLKFHYETAERAGFSLVVGKNGPKLGSAKGEDVTLDFGAQGKPGRGGPVNLTLRKYSLAALANLLSQVGPGPVVDKTALSGEYDFTLAWDETNGPALTTAVQEQLGLKLEPTKVSVSTFVIDSAEKPEVD